MNASQGNSSVLLVIPEPGCVEEVRRFLNLALGASLQMSVYQRPFHENHPKLVPEALPPISFNFIVIDANKSERKRCLPSWFLTDIVERIPRAFVLILVENDAHTISLVKNEIRNFKGRASHIPKTSLLSLSDQKEYVQWFLDQCAEWIRFRLTGKQVPSRARQVFDQIFEPPVAG